MMDMQKENNLIQEAFEVEADEIGFCLDQKWGDYENPYESSDTALAFNLFEKGWQAAKAQAVPEGFVLVPREMPKSFDEGLYVYSNSISIVDECSDGFIPMSDINHAEVWKLVIEAQEQANESK